LTHLRNRASWKRALLALAVGLLGAFTFAQAAGATHQSPVGASPARGSFVPAYAQCTTPDQAHNPPLGFPSCSPASASPPTPRSSVAKFGPSSIGFLRIVVCPSGSPVAFCNPANPPNPPGGVWAQPDVRVTGNITDVRCLGGPNCPTPGTSPYDPHAGSGPPYTSAGTGSTAPTPPCFPLAPNPPGSVNPNCSAGQDMTLTGTIPGEAAGTNIRITGHNNTLPGNGTGEGSIPVPIDCQPAGSGGSNCGVNTSFNALFPGAVKSGFAEVIELGQSQLNDAGVDGIVGNADDGTFAVQGIFEP